MAATELDRAIEILKRRPRLAAAVIEIDEMTAGRRTCRVSLDISSGILRVYREVPVRQIQLTEPAAPGPGG